MIRQSVQALFDQTAIRYGDKTAIDSTERRVSYRSLQEQANKLANFLVARGTPKGSLVAVYAGDAVEVITAMIGIVKAGCAFVPIDPELPAKRVRTMLSEASPSVFIAEKRCLANLASSMEGADFRAKVICLDDKPPASFFRQETPLQCVEDYFEFSDLTPPEVKSEPDDVCYIYFTSGSTGKPKAIAGRLKGLTHFIQWEIRTFGVDAEARVSQLTTPSFDPFLRDVFVPLCSGGTVCVPQNREIRLDPRALIRWIDAQRITLIHCVPSLLRAIVNERLLRTDFRLLRHVLLAGEPLLPVDVNQWMDVFGSRIQLANLLGPTETTLAKFCYLVQPGDGQRRSIPIGKPIEGAAAIVVDSKGNACSPGMVGEIYIRTPYRSLGYYKRPELTDKVFIPNPFSKDPDDIVYKTGDLGRILEDGNFEFLGRKDHQVKIRGMRIELAEIECILRAHAAVEDVVVVDRDDSRGNKFLCAYVVLGKNRTRDSLQEYVADHLPDYMVPSAMVEMDELPRNLNGKVDRRALPTPSQLVAGHRRDFVAPRTPVEEMVADIWRELLGLHRVGVHDRFFELGGHSLLATQVLSRLRECLQTEVPLRQFLQDPTVAGIAQQIENGRDGGRKLTPLPIERNPRDGDLPLSYAQQRLWFIHQMDPQSALYNIFAPVRLTGALRVKILQTVLTEIVRRHEVLRAVFTSAEGHAAQTIQPATKVSLPVVDLRELSSPGHDRERRRLAQSEANQPFDLARGPLIRATLIRLGQSEYDALLTLHHAVSDAWSAEILMREIATLYEAFHHEQPSPLGELPVQYVDYASWQRHWLSGDVLDAQLAYWKETLAGAPASLRLPTDRPRPAVQRFGGAHVSLELSRDLKTPLVELSRREGATLFMTLLAAFKTLLQRYTSQDDIVVGTPVANRSLVETETLVGCFVNMLVLRTDLAGNPSFRELLRRVREGTLNAASHKDLPFERLVDELQPERELSQSPLFQVAFVVETSSMEQLHLPDLVLEPLEFDRQTAKFDLTLYVVNTEDGLVARAEYNRDLFEPDAMGRLLGHYENLLTAIVNNPDESINHLPLLSSAEHQQLVGQWNERLAVFAGEPSVHERFQARVQHSPDAVALVFENCQLTYRTLNERANRLAHYLRAHGVGPEVPVAIFMERSLELVTAILGTLKSGGAYVPLDPTYPPERISFILSDCQARVVVTHKSVRSSLPHFNGCVVSIDDDWHTIRQYGGYDPEDATKPEHLAYVIYTSGSTGKPKGCLVTHGNLVRLFHATDEWYGFGDDVWTLFHSSAFDFSVWEIWGALMYGGRLVVVPYEVSRSPEQFCQLIEQEAVTVLNQTPSAFQQLVAATQREEGFSGANLRWVIFGGEALDISALQPWFRRPMHRQAHLVNMYGITETTVHVTVRAVSVQDAESVTASMIGGAIPDMGIYLLDGALVPVPVGVAGEIYVRGAGVARGYWNRQELTAERFVPDPYSASATGARVYRSGDLARYRSDGDLQYLGRLDHQVQLRGFRVELGEIEAALSQHPGVRQAVALIREGQAKHRQIVACFVNESEPVPRAAALRRFLSDKLPDYMIPSTFVPLEALPLTQNGKIDRRALLAAGAPGWSPDRPRVAPRTEVEQQLARVWSEVLGIELVGIHDNFFELGGDSILCIQVVGKAKSQGIDLQPPQLFRHQTIAELAAVAGQVQRPKTPQGKVSGAVPLTPIQHWFFERELANPNHFNQSVLLKVRRALQPKLLRESLSKLLSHHDALRHRFVREPSGWRQWVAPSVDDVPFAYIDLSRVAPSRHREIVAEAAQSMQTSLHLFHGPLIRVAYFDFGPQRAGRLFAVANHLVVDAFSWRILLEDLYTGYVQMVENQRVQLPLKTTSFQHCAHRLTNYPCTDAARKDREYWLRLARIPHEPLPKDTDAAQTPVVDRAAETVMVSLGEKLTVDLLRNVSEAYRTQINDLLLTALSWVLCQWSGKRSMLIDLEGHGRDLPLEAMDVSRTVGWFTTIHPVRLKIAVRSDFSEAIKSVKEQLRAAARHSHGFGVLKYLEPDRAFGCASRPLSQAGVLFNYLGQLDLAMPETMPFEPVDEPSGSTTGADEALSHPLVLNGGVTDRRLRFVWTFDPHRYHRDTIADLAGRFVETLGQLIAHCKSQQGTKHTPSDFPLARLTQSRVDALQASYPTLQDVYPLSAMQEGMLFHGLYQPKSGVYVTQVSCEIRGLDASALADAWRHVVQQHPVLRTAFVWQDVEHPLQVVQERIDLPTVQHDWRELTRRQQQQHLTRYLKEDRDRGFDFSRAPLMRLATFRLDDVTHRIVWTSHHVLLDGWSMPLLLNDVFARYTSVGLGRDDAGAPRRPYRDYIQWLQSQTTSRAEPHWREVLQGISRPTPLDKKPAAAGKAGNSVIRKNSVLLSRKATDALTSFGRRQKLTLNTLVQGAWALRLASESGHRDVVFGTTVSGRPTDLSGAESMIGLFINTLPLRVQVVPEATLVDWLQQIQRRQVELRQFEYSSLNEVRAWSDVPSQLPLFESIVVFENYPVDVGAFQENAATGLELLQVDTIIQNNLPFTVRAVPGQRLGLDVLYDSGQFETAQATRTLQSLVSLLRAMPREPRLKLASLLETLHESDSTSVRQQEAAFRHSRRSKLSEIRRKVVS